MGDDPDENLEERLRELFGDVIYRYTDHDAIAAFDVSQIGGERRLRPGGDAGCVKSFHPRILSSEGPGCPTPLDRLRCNPIRIDLASDETVAPQR